MTKNALIIGCGIAGPALALFLKRAGINSTIFDAANAPLDHVGLMLYVGPSGCNVLKTLGVYDKVESAGSRCEKVTFNDHGGKNIVEFVQTEHEKDFGSTTIAIKRGDINKILREETESSGIKIMWGKNLKDIKISEDKTVSAFFADDSKVEGDFLVGCDGINSRTRKIVMPDAPSPKFSHSFVVGGTTDVPVKMPTNTLSFNFGKKAFFAHYAMSSGKKIWWSDVRIPENSIKEKLAIPNDQWKDILLNLHDADDDLFKKLVESTKDKFLRLPISDLPSLPNWHHGSICLTGDAAHAVVPHAGQGASLSLESAIILAKCIRDIPDIEKAFTTYENIRRNRVEMINKLSRKNVNLFAPKNPIQSWFRKLVVSLISPMVMKKRRGIVYGYKIDWNDVIHE